ncbi:ion channel domain-containing protein [Ditylenchus destructor]|nr:ion channel domain-containing protein [Ditylenchus destructor]
MVLGIGLYTLAGAYIIQNLEATRTDGYSHHRNVRQTSLVDHSGEIPQNTSSAHFHQHSFRAHKHALTRSRKCVVHTMRQISSEGRCQMEKESLLESLDQCYEQDLKMLLRMTVIAATNENIYSETRRKSKVSLARETDDEGWEYWTFKDSVVFCFTLITTIGYGNVAPQTVRGQAFVILYGLIGIPFTMLAIANIGQFLARFLRYIIMLRKSLYRRIRGAWNRIFRSRDATTPHLSSIIYNRMVRHGDYYSSSYDENETEETFVLLIAFVLYIILGSFAINAYEPNMDYSKAIYFNFITLMTIGLGDIVPQNARFLPFTLAYFVMGLALTTCAIEIFANYLRKLHYFGRNVDRVANIHVWFGAKRLTIKQLVKGLGDQFDLPEKKIEKLNLETLVQNAIKVESGEIAPFRSVPTAKSICVTDLCHGLRDGRIIFIDEDTDSCQ